MRLRIRFSMLALSLAMLDAQTGSSDPGGLLSQLTVARFVGSGSQSIQAMASDAAGNLYVAGTTSSPDLPVKNAAQPSIGEALLLRSVDRGATWQKLSNPPTLPVTITAHPSDPQALFVGSADGIYKTTDGGQTWRHVYAWAPFLLPDAANIPSGDCCLNIAIDPANTRNAYLYASFGYDIRFAASSDGGESWQARRAPPPIAIRFSSAKALWVDPNGSGTVTIGLSFSRDRGLTWMDMTKPPMLSPSFTVPDPRHAGWVYAATSAGITGRLYLSKDWGITWIERPSPMRNGGPPSLALDDLLFDPDLANTLYADAVFGSTNISNDAGDSWHATGNFVFSDSGKQPALLSRQCMGGALLSVSSGSVAASFDFGATRQPAQLSRVVNLTTGPGCAVYAARSIASDVFIAKLAPGGSEVLWSTYLGGSDLDVSAALALDSEGNVYVAGNTASTDFPTTAPRVGPQGRQNAFAAKLDSDGKLIYSVVFGGESSDSVTGLSVNAQGEAHIAGWTTSQSFPATPGAFQTQPGSTDGFALKLGSGGAITYASYLPNFAPASFPPPYFNPPPTMVVVAAEASGSALVGGYAGMLARIAPDGSSLAVLSRQPGQIYTMETDQQGNTYIAGQTTGAGSGPCFQGFTLPSLEAGDIFVNKLQPGSLEQIYSGRIAGKCQSRPGALKIGPTGEVTLGLWTYDGFPLRNPVLLAPRNCSSGGAVVARFSADGLNVLFSSYLDACSQAPAVALAPDGSVYAGVRAYLYFAPAIAAGIVRIPIAPSGGMRIDGAFNAFSGFPAYAAPGMLLTITGQNLAPAFLDLGLNYANPLPTALGGVQVLFDGAPAEMFQVDSDHVICVVPAALKGSDSVLVQVVSGSQVATPFVLQLFNESRGFLTRSFPNLPPSGPVDGNIRNADGTLNDADHPAAPGSNVTLFATGLSGPGDTRLLWNAPPPQRFQFLLSLPGTVYSVPGFVDALYAIDFRIPDSPGPGVYLVPTPGVLTRAVIGTVDNGIGVYVK